MEIIDIFRENEDRKRSVQMAAYMKNRFPFLGLTRPRRNELQGDILREKKKEKTVDWEWIFSLYACPEREFHYLAVDFVRASSRKMSAGDLAHVESMIRSNSWWDTVDALAPVVGDLVNKYPPLKEEKVRHWITDEDFWIRRVSILFQLKYREMTDTGFLTEAITGNFGSSEFFINKAIGWALREYSKTDPDWVRQFVENNPLAPLSRREASKYL